MIKGEKMSLEKMIQINRDMAIKKIANKREDLFTDFIDEFCDIIYDDSRFGVKIINLIKNDRFFRYKIMRKIKTILENKDVDSRS